jgi:glycosyltransferase involved in cell wall biosynthesis
LPVLASQLAAVSEVIRTYHVGRILSSAAPTEIGAAISTMLADPDTLALMRSNALKVAQEEFHWEKERQQLIGLYHEILRKKQ